jgi:ADP-ribose pyrophosphatase YjhB (NUDIX family)
MHDSYEPEQRRRHWPVSNPATRAWHARSPRGRIITNAFHFDLGDAEFPDVQGADDAKLAKWMPLAELPSLESQLFEDHACILDHFVGLYPAP